MTFTLTVANRDKAVKNNTLRANGQVPGVVYGPKHQPTQVVVDGKELEKVLKEAGESSIIQLSGTDDKSEVLIKEVDFDPIRRMVRHVDFYAIERGKEMTVVVPLHFVGVSPAEKDGVGTVTKTMHEIEVTCRPSALPQHIDVDVSVLVTDESKITVADLVVPAGVTVENEPTEVIAVISVAEEESETSSAIDMSAIEVEKKGKVEDEA